MGPYSSIGNGVKLVNSELENSIIMEGARIDCGKRIIDSLIGKDVDIVNSSFSNGVKFIIGDASKISI